MCLRRHSFQPTAGTSRLPASRSSRKSHHSHHGSLPAKPCCLRLRPSPGLSLSLMGSSRPCTAAFPFGHGKDSLESCIFGCQRAEGGFFLLTLIWTFWGPPCGKNEKFFKKIFSIAFLAGDRFFLPSPNGLTI